MALRLFLLTAVVGFAPSTSGRAAEPAPADAAEAKQLADVLRTLFLANVPDPLVSSRRGWDHQKEVVVGLKWHGLRPEPQKAIRNDGVWQKVSVHAIDAPTTLAIGIRGLRHPEPGKATFEAMVGLDTRIVYEQQVWKSGVRLYGGETRARCRTAVRLACELTDRIDRRPGALLPDVVVRLRVTEAEVFYTDLVCEHTLGLEGNAAKRLGETVHRFLTAVKPNVEKDLLARANAAVVKAADSKEVRIELDKLLAGRSPVVPVAPRK